jgi:Holliday junction resolvase RusA-like endonuclease
MDAITFEIPGPAIPQPRARSTRGGRMYTPTKNGINVFKQAVGLMARATAAAAGWRASDAPHEITVECVFERPASHLTKGGELRAGQPIYPGHRNGDWDNLAKGVQDAITTEQVIWLDDSQVVDGRCRKRYAARGEVSRTIVTVRRLPA